MLLSVSWTVLLLSVRYGLCEFETDSVQADTHSESSLSDLAEKKINAGHVIFDNAKTSKEANSLYNRDDIGFSQRRQDTKIYDDQDKAYKGQDNGRHSSGESELTDRRKNSFEQHGNGYYKKGHHRTGFSNNYHKDESGNNSSFYEDSDDEGGHRSLENSGGYYGQKSQDSFRDGSRDSSYIGRDRTRQKLSDNRENYNNYLGYTDGYNRNRYNDDKRSYLHDEAGHYYDQNGKEIYHHRERFRPIPYHIKDHVQPYEYSRFHVETLPKDYYKGNPYTMGYSRYFPARETYYPEKRYFDGGFPYEKYDNDFHDKHGGAYHPYTGYRRY